MKEEGQQTVSRVSEGGCTHLESLSEQGGWERSLDGGVAPVMLLWVPGPFHCTTQRGGCEKEQRALLGVSGQLRKWLGG